jgi:hypothetical protein
MATLEWFALRAAEEWHIARLFHPKIRAASSWRHIRGLAHESLMFSLKANRREGSRSQLTLSADYAHDRSWSARIPADGASES